MEILIPLSEILSRVKPFSDYVQSERVPYPDLCAFESELQTGTHLNWSEDFNERVKVMPVNAWLCTDTTVGVNAYYLDGEFVSLSFQRYRKDDVEFKWKSEADARKVQTLIRRISEKNEELNLELLDAEEQVSIEWIRER